MKKKNISKLANKEISRRLFLSRGSKAATAALLLAGPLQILSAQQANLVDVTVGDIMYTFIKEVPGSPFADTVDTLKAGTRDTKVTGVVTSTFATIDVVKKAIELKANFIIVHEPVFYNHADDTDWLANDPVYLFKAGLLSQHNIAVWRNHDYIHRHVPDGVKQAVVSTLGWTNNFDVATNIAQIQALSLKQLIEHCKKKLGIASVRYIGNLSMPAKKILLMPGAAGGKRQIEAVKNTQPDVIICGEIQEWETAEYIRDAGLKGQQIALIVLGHIVSEQPGSEYMATWLKEKYPSLNTVFVPTKPSLQFA